MRGNIHLIPAPTMYIYRACPQLALWCQPLRSSLSASWPRSRVCNIGLQPPHTGELKVTHMMQCCLFAPLLVCASYIPVRQHCAHAPQRQVPAPSRGSFVHVPVDPIIPAHPATKLTGIPHHPCLSCVNPVCHRLQVLLGQGLVHGRTAGFHPVRAVADIGKHHCHCTGTFPSTYGC